MREPLKLFIAFLIGFSVSLVFMGFMNKPNEVDPVKLAEYTACLNRVDFLTGDSGRYYAVTKPDGIYSYCRELRP